MQSPASSLLECWAYFTKMVYDILYLHIIEHFHVFLRTTGLLWCAAPRFFPNFAGGYPPPRPQRVSSVGVRRRSARRVILRAPAHGAQQPRPALRPILPAFRAPSPCLRPSARPRHRLPSTVPPTVSPVHRPTHRASRPPSPAHRSSRPPSPAHRASRLPSFPLPRRHPHIRKQHTPHHCVVCFSYGASARSMASRLACETRLPCSQS